MNYTYDVALSFAGEDRKFTEAVASGLRAVGNKVFYDDYYATDLWGEDLSVSLREVYHDNSRFCIMIISAHYVEKMWPNFKRQQAIEGIIRQKGKAYILPVRLDWYSGDIPGLSGTIGFLAVDSSESERVTTREAIFALHDNEKEEAQFKVWIGGIFRSDSISLSHGNNIDIENDSSLNESLFCEDNDGELVLKPVGMGMFGDELDRPISTNRAAEYLWKLACQNL